MTTIIIAPETASNFLDAFGSVDFADDVAPRMTCVEVETVISLLRAVGGESAAAVWLDAHAEEDEEGDSHYLPPPPAYVVPVDPMDYLQCDSCQ
jgi:hypothetical protein